MTMRVPVALWQDFAGAYTACVIDGPMVSAYDLTAAAALAQLKHYLTWSLRKGRVAVRNSDLVDLELCDYRLEYRPEYRVDETLYPIAYTASGATAHCNALLQRSASACRIKPATRSSR
jgi:hypothetical protein